jgi:hypothetical protein
MTMTITFRAHGLKFEAEVDYTPLIPGRFSGPPERCYPDEGGECEITALTCDGKDALFLLASMDLAPDIESAAADAAEEALRDARDQARIDAYCDL